MLTIDENRDNCVHGQGIRQKFELINYHSKAICQQLKPGDTDNIRRGMSTHYVSGQQMLLHAKQFNEFYVNGDDGYCTDSRSYKSTSISSSLSSLSATEGCSNSGTALSTTPGAEIYIHTSSQNSSMQSGPIQKGNNLPLNSRTNVGINSGIAVKRRGVKVEEPVNTISLEDRLRALTTIEEEEAGLSMNDRSINPHNASDNGTTRTEKSTISPTHLRFIKTAFENINFETPSDYMSGYYRALPVDIIAKDSHVLSNSADEGFSSSKSGTRNDNFQIRSHDDEIVSPSLKMNRNSWKDYMQFLEKDSVVSAHNIDMAVQRELLSSGVNNSVGMVNHILGSPVVSRHHEIGFSQNNGRAMSAPIMNQSGNYQIGELGLHRQGDDSSAQSALKESFDINGRAQSSSGIYLLRSMQDFQLDNPSQVSGQTSVPIIPNQVFTQQEYPFEDHMKQQGEQHQHYRQHQPGYHEQAYPNSYQHHANLEPSFRIPMNSSFSEMQAQAYHGRSSCQSGCSFEQHFVECKQPDLIEVKNSSSNLENIPKLYKQIRATSEQCLQASRKHIFASSADINKLFSGQKNPATSLQIRKPDCYQLGTRENPLKTSIQSHVTETLWPGYSQIIQESSKPKLRVMMPNVSTQSCSSPTPIRVDHNVHIPPDAWTNVVSLPNSAQSEVNRSHFHSHSHSLPTQADQHRFSVQKSLLADTDLGTERSQLHCLTSGYSSESELQQIESNAEAVKKHSKFQGEIDNSQNNLLHEFVPLNRSIDQDSSVDTDNFDDLEPVYENQSMLLKNSTFDPLNQPSDAVGYSQTVSQWQQQFTSHQGGYSEVPPYMSMPQPQTRSFQGSPSTSSFNNNSDIVTFNNNIKAINTNSHQDRLIATITLTNKPVAIAGHVPSPSNRFLEYNSNTSSNLNKETGPTTLFTHYPSQHIHSLPDLPEFNRNGHHSSPALYSNLGHSVPGGGHAHLQNRHLDYQKQNNNGNFVQLSPVEIVRVLDVPFETTIICDEQGDRLSTLV